MADKSQMQSNGGQQTFIVAAGTGADVAASTQAGRLCKLYITTTGSAQTLIYDSATTTGAAGAVLIYASSAALAAGDVVDLQIPVSTGIVPKRVTNTAGFALGYTVDRVQGRE